MIELLYDGDVVTTVECVEDAHAKITMGDKKL